MLSDSDEPFVTIGQVIAKLPGGRGNPRPSPSTVTRWIISGVRGIAGTTVRLKATRVGFRWLLKQSDIDDFFSALGALPTDPPSTRSPTARANLSDAASAKLAALGA
jgi:hypothetical protein